MQQQLLLQQKAMELERQRQFELRQQQMELHRQKQLQLQQRQQRQQSHETIEYKYDWTIGKADEHDDDTTNIGMWHHWESGISWPCGKTPAEIMQFAAQNRMRVEQKNNHKQEEEGGVVAHDDDEVLE